MVKFDIGPLSVVRCPFWALSSRRAGRRCRGFPTDNGPLTTDYQGLNSASCAVRNRSQSRSSFVRKARWSRIKARLST